MFNQSDYDAGYHDGWSNRTFCPGVNRDYLAGYARGHRDRAVPIPSKGAANA